MPARVAALAIAKRPCRSSGCRTTPQQMAADQVHRGRGGAVADGIFGQAGVRLDRVAEGIHAGLGRERRRQAKGHPGVENGHVGQQEIRGKGYFDAALMVGNHRHQRHLRAGPGRRGHGDQRFEPLFQSPGPRKGHQVFGIFGNHDVDALGRVHHRTASHGDHRVASVLPIHRRQAVDRRGPRNRGGRRRRSPRMSPRRIGLRHRRRPDRRRSPPCR